MSFTSIVKNELSKLELNKLVEQIKEETYVYDEEEIEYASVFIFNGALGIVNYWVKNNFDKPVNEIVETIKAFPKLGNAF